MIIDMTPFANPPHNRLFVGADAGARARKELRLDKLDKKDGVVSIVFSSKTWAITSSFFLAAFGDSVRKLGKEGFNNKYHFVVSSEIGEDIRDGIDEWLKSHVKDGIHRSLKSGGGKL